MHLKKRNQIQLTVSLIVLLGSIASYCLINWQHIIPLGAKFFLAALATTVISLCAISAIRWVTKTYRAACVVIPFVAMLVPIFSELFAMLATIDPSPLAMDNLTIFAALSKQLFTTGLITAAILSLGILLWELSHTKKIGSQNVPLASF